MGMKPVKLFLMVVLEAFFMSGIGTTIGFVLGWLIYLPLSENGVNLSVFAESLSSFGIGAIIYPVLSVDSVINAITIVPAVTVLAACYPAYRAIQLKPVEAISHV